MVTILLAEDDPNLRKLMTAYLEQNNYQVIQAKSGKQALNMLEQQHIDMLISDVMMPEMNGLELSAMLREANYQFPILMVTAKETLEDKKKGFRAGTDDYMVKPVDMEEMLLRVEALLRRAKINNEKQLTIGDVVLDYEKLTVQTPDETIELPKKEFYLLYKLLSYPKKIFTRAQLMDEIWGYDAEADERTVDVHIKRLREKFEHVTDFQIVTIRGLGYKAERT